MHWNGVMWEQFNVSSTQFNGYIKRFYGTTGTDLYMVGTNGQVAHYNGKAWSKLESETTLDVQDIWGSADPRTGEQEILCVAGNYYVSRERRIMSLDGTSVTRVSDSGINWALNSVWFSAGRRYWVVGDGIWEKRSTLTMSRWSGGPNLVTNYVTNRVRGNDINDVYICGAFGELLHFNGISWQSFRSYTGLSAGQYLSIAVKGNMLVAVGYQADRAVVLRGRHSP